MTWELRETPIDGCYFLKNPVFKDLRGEFSETYKRSIFQELHLPEMLQDNHLITNRGGVRAMHWQDGEHSQAKLINVIEGEIFDAVYDLRKTSKTFKKLATFEMNSDSPLLFIPSGCAHGFQAVSALSIVHYKTDKEYNAASQRAFLWNDPQAGISWPITEALVSERDQQSASLQSALENV